MSTTTNPTVPAKVWSESVELPEYTDAKVLAAGVSGTYTTPTNCNWWLLSADGGFYIKKAASVAVPAIDVTDGTAGFYVPAGLQCRVAGGIQVALISASNRVVTIAPYPA